MSSQQPFPFVPAQCWSEGQFIKPQHFQRFARERSSEVRYWTTLGRPEAFYGVRRFDYKEDLIAKGKLEITCLDAVFQDGTIVQYPLGNIQKLEVCDFGDVLESSKSRSITIFSCIPPYAINRPNVARVVSDRQVGPPPRYVLGDESVRDENSGEEETKTIIDVRWIRASLSTVDRSREGYLCIPLVRVTKSTTEGALPHEDNNFCPPLLAAYPKSMVRSKAEDLLTSLKQLVQGMIEDVSLGFDPEKANNYDILDIYRLSAYQAALSKIHNILKCPDPDPFLLFLELHALLASVSAVTIDAASYKAPDYSAADPGLCFVPLYAEIQRLCETTKSRETPVFKFRPADGSRKLWIVDLQDAWLKNPLAQYYLAIKKGQGMDDLESFKVTAALGARQKVKEDIQYKDVRLNLESAKPPRFAPKTYNYFSIDTKTGTWGTVQNDRVLAIFTRNDPGDGIFALCVYQRR